MPEVILTFHDPKEIEIDFTNWRGERSWRKCIPMRLGFVYGTHNANAVATSRLCLTVSMSDRQGAPRSIEVSKIHAIRDIS